MPFPYARFIVGTRQCRVLISGYINSDATGFDINRQVLAYKKLWKKPKNKKCSPVNYI